MRFPVISFLVGLVAGRWTEGSIKDSDSPLVVLYYDNWARWVREYGVTELEKNFLSRDLPFRNVVINYAFFAWNPLECTLSPTDHGVDMQKGDTGGISGDDWDFGADKAGGMLTAVMMLKEKYPHMKVLPSVGGWSRSHTFEYCINNKMDIMVSSTIDVVRQFGFDGIDLDWEYPNCDGKPCGCQNEDICPDSKGLGNKSGPNDWELVKEFTTKLREKFDSLEDEMERRLYITAALGINPKLIDGGNEIWSKPTPYEWMCDTDVMDWMNLMTYDLYGPWDALTGPLAPLYSNPNLQGNQMSIDDSVQRILKRCSRPEKLTMGLATYGKTWEDVPKEGTPPGLWQKSTSARIRTPGTWEMGTISFWDTTENIIPNCEITFDEISKTNTAYCATMPDCKGCLLLNEGGTNINYRDRAQESKDVFITFEDKRAWTEKMKYAKEHGFSGAIIWAASDFGGGNSNAPDVAGELSSGIIEGWTGKSYTSSAPGTVGSFSYEKLSKWPKYPCPLPGIDVTSDKQLSHNCATSGPYDITKAFRPETIGSGNKHTLGKDKVLIFKGDGNGTQPTSSPSSSSSSSTSSSSSSSSVSTTSSTTTTKTSGGGDRLTECQNFFTDNVDIMVLPNNVDFCREQCVYYDDSNQWGSWCVQVGGDLKDCVIRYWEACKVNGDPIVPSSSTTSTTTTTTKPASTTSTQAPTCPSTSSTTTTKAPSSSTTSTTTRSTTSTTTRSTTTSTSTSTSTTTTKSTSASSGGGNDLPGCLKYFDDNAGSMTSPHYLEFCKERCEYYTQPQTWGPWCAPVGGSLVDCVMKYNYDACN